MALRSQVILGWTAVAAAAVVLAGSAPSAAGGFVGTEWSRLPTRQHVVALTFVNSVGLVIADAVRIVRRPGIGRS